MRPETFRQMIEVVRSQSTPKRKTGRPGKLSLEDQLLMTLEYWSGAGDTPPPESTELTSI
ncbi:hypothetical protein [Nostoc sp.]|uniref:hypothetical protein n=1 Tax=Nostoc sp. TaxID=1180 RepID=UPI002FF73F93